MAFQIGDFQIKELEVDRAVKAATQASFKFRQSATIESGNNGWTQNFWREDQTILTAGVGRDIRGVPQLAKPPEMSPQWEQLNTTLQKHMADLIVPWEDRMRSDFNMFERALVKMGEAVAASEDNYIWDVIEADTAVQTQDIGTGWDVTNGDPWADLLSAVNKIGQRPYNYPTGDLHVHVRRYDMSSIMKYITQKGAAWPRVSEDTVTNRNGVQGTLGPFTFIVNEAIDPSQCLVCVPRIGFSVREMQGLQTFTTVDDMISIRIRTGLISVPKITDPKAMVVLSGTQDV